MTYILFLAVALLVVALVTYRREQHKNSILFANLVAERNDLFTGWKNGQKLNAGITAKLLIAKGALNDIASQNYGDPYFEIWARKRAADTLALIERK